MLTHPARTQSRLAQIADGGLFMLSLGCAYSLRVALTPVLDLPALEPITDYLWLFAWVGIVGPMLLQSQGLYEQSRLTSRLSVALIVVRGSVFTVIGTILLLFLLRAQFARSVVMLVGGLGCLLVYARHELSQWSRRGDVWRKRVLWVGQPQITAELRQELSALEHESIETVAEIDASATSEAAFIELMHRESINAVVFDLTQTDRAHWTPLLDACEREGVEYLIRPDLPRHTTYRLAIDEFGGAPVIHVRAQTASPGQLVVKQVIDYAGALLGLLLALPLALLIALVIKATSPGPVLFCQKRAGINGREFTMLKFRTMRPGAETEQSDLADRNEMKGPVFKLSADPRVTPFGRFLRRHSLDELPQLWNVLRGEMSLVGPRPLPVSEVAAIADSAQRRRLSVKPGLTGLWQISGRNDLNDFADWVRLDLAYIDQWSLWFDLKILLATLPVALLGRGGR